MIMMMMMMIRVSYSFTHVQLYLYCKSTWINHRHVEVEIKTVFVLLLEISHEPTKILQATSWQCPRQLVHVWNSLTADRSEVLCHPDAFPAASRHRWSSKALGRRVLDTEKRLDRPETGPWDDHCAVRWPLLGRVWDRAVRWPLRREMTTARSWPPATSTTRRLTCVIVGRPKVKFISGNVSKNAAIRWHIVKISNHFSSYSKSTSSFLYQVFRLFHQCSCSFNVSDITYRRIELDDKLCELTSILYNFSDFDYSVLIAPIAHFHVCH